MSTKELQADNLKLCQKGLELMKVLEQGFLKLGEVLMEIRNNQAYYPQWESFGDYLEEGHVMSEANASKLITVYNRYIIKMQEPEQELVKIGWSKLYDLHRTYDEDQELRDAMLDASLLTTSHLRQKLHEKKAGVDQTTCKHTNTYTIKVCRDCNFREKIYEQE